jgi:hypothetical protein
MFSSVSSQRAEFLANLCHDAEEIIDGVDSSVVPPYDGEDGPSFRMAFCDYPKATAYRFIFFPICSFDTHNISFPLFSVKGIYYREKARHACDTLEKIKLYEKAGDFYVRAADCLPDDDESHVGELYVLFVTSFSLLSYTSFIIANLAFAIGNLIKTEILISIIIELIERVKTAEPKMKKIWQRSTFLGRDKEIDAVLSLEKDLRNLLMKGIVNNVIRDLY